MGRFIERIEELASQEGDPVATAEAFYAMTASYQQSRRYVKNAKDVDRDPKVLAAAHDVLVQLNFDPMREAVELYQLAKSKGKMGQQRLILRDIMEFAYPKYRAQEHTHNIRAVQIVYQDQLSPDQGPTLEYQHTVEPDD